MTTDITLYGRSVQTVFDLLGDKENDITYSLGWTMNRSNRLTGAASGPLPAEEARSRA